MSGSDATVTISVDDNKNNWPEDDSTTNQIEDEETEDERDSHGKLGVDGVRFMSNPECDNHEPELVVDEWTIDDVLKQRMSDSKSKIWRL